MKRALIILALFLVIVAIALSAYYFFRKDQDPNILFLYGNVDVRQVDIAFRVSGQVEQLFFEEGDYVSAGTLLATLNKTPYDSQLQEAEAALESSKASFNNAEQLFNRRQQLIGVSGVSQEDLETSQSTYSTSKAAVSQAEAALSAAKDNLSYTQAFAPTEGVILTRIREPGSAVNQFEPVYTLSITSPLWIRAFIDEPHLGRIYYGMPAEIYTDTKGGPVYTGQIGFISPIAEFTPKTVETTQLRTDLVYRLRIYVDNPGRFLKQGMPVTIKLRLCDQADEGGKRSNNTHESRELDEK